MVKTLRPSAVYLRKRAAFKKLELVQKALEDDGMHLPGAKIQLHCMLVDEGHVPGGWFLRYLTRSEIVDASFYGDRV